LLAGDMTGNEGRIPAHPMGESGEGDLERVEESDGAVETFGPKVFVRWDREAAVTAFGPVTCFIEFLKSNGLW